MNFPWDLTVNNRSSFESLTSSTYILAIILAIVLIGITYFITNHFIGFQPNGSDVKKRKMAFYSVLSLGVFSLAAYNWLYVSKFITKASLLAKFSGISGTIVLSTTMFIVTYYVVIRILAFVMPNQPINTIFA